MQEQARKSRAIYNHAGRMYALLEEIMKRSHDAMYKLAAAKMVREIQREAGEYEVSI